MANDIRADLIEEGIMKAFKSSGDYDQGDMLVDWIVVAYTENPDIEKGGAYPMLFSNGSMAHYKAVGLLTNALEMLKPEISEL